MADYLRWKEIFYEEYSTLFDDKLIRQVGYNDSNSMIELGKKCIEKTCDHEEKDFRLIFIGIE